MTNNHTPRLRGIPPPVPIPAAFDVRAAASELLGANWTEPLAYMLGVNLRTVQRWANRQNTVPEPIGARIVEMLAIVRRFRTASSSPIEQALYQLSDAGHELFGEHWQAPLGVVLGVDADRMEHWAQHIDSMPETVPQFVSELLAIARRSRDDAAKDRARSAAERKAPDWDATGRDIAGRYPATLVRRQKR